jgi:hypothetical protein
MKIKARVNSSTDPRCKVGTIGHVPLFASYNGVRSDSVQFFFPTACKDHNHLYHGPQVNNQVPPLYPHAGAGSHGSLWLTPPKGADGVSAGRG